jgi:hypothetical protein
MVTVNNDLTETIRTAYRYYWQAMQPYLSHRHLTSPIRMRPEDFSLTDQEVYGLTVWDDYSTSPSAQAVKSLSHSTAVIDKQVLARFTVPEVIRNPGILFDAMAKFGFLYGYTVDTMFWAILKNVLVTAHPYQGKAVFDSETPLYCVDDFTIIPANPSLAPGGASIAQSNKYAYSFDDTYIHAMIADRNEYFDFSGNAVEADPGINPSRPIILGHSQYKPKAEAIMMQMGQIYDGSGLKLGVNGSVDPVGFVSPPAGNLTDEWGLWYLRQEVSQRDGVVSTGPIAPVEFYPGTVEIEPPREGVISVVGHGGVNIRVSGNIHTDLQWSTP